MDIEITKMQNADAETLYDITAKTLDVKWTKEMYLAELGDKTKHYFVAKVDDTVVGFVGAQLVLDNADITNIAVLPEFREKGLGRRLLDTLIADAKTCGIETLTLEVSEYNINAVRFYEKLGFIRNGARKGYYPDGATALLYIRRLS